MTRSVGILTFHGGYNFGAVLQAFALQRAVVSLGHSCTIIDYRQPDMYHLFKPPVTLSYLKSDLLTLMNLRSIMKSRKRYAQFRSSFMNLTTKSYRTMDGLSQEDLGFDTYVTGSDQVWHPNLLDKSTSAGPIFYLDFVSVGRRVAYAPSFGLAEIPSRHHDRTARFLQQFDFLSARESTGYDIIQKLTGRTAAQVMDPSFLQTAVDYEKVAVEPAMGKPYILLYPLQLSARLRVLALKARTHLGLPIVAVLPNSSNPRRFAFADRVVLDAGPSEFLGLVKDAAFVCTNSFHGTCFSIIYRKSFLGVPCAIGNSRLESLLACFNLSSRQVIEPALIRAGDPLLEPLDYKLIEPRIQLAIEKSLDYLHRALS